MFKTMYLITFLSVVLFNSETSFGQGLKKELGICGKSMNAIFKAGEKINPTLETAVMKDEEFCDNGRYEQGANFVIKLYNASDKLVYDKYIYLNPMVFHEGFDEKEPTKFAKTKIVSDSNSRIVKFPVSKEMGEITKYKVESLLKDKKVYDIQKIKW